MRQLQVRCTHKKQRLCQNFCGPRKCTSWSTKGYDTERALRRKGLPERMLAAILVLYVESKPLVRQQQKHKKSLVLEWVYVKAVLSLLLLIIVIEEATLEAKK